MNNIINRNKFLDECINESSEYDSYREEFKIYDISFYKIISKFSKISKHILIKFNDDINVILLPKKYINDHLSELYSKLIKYVTDFNIMYDTLIYESSELSDESLGLLFKLQRCKNYYDYFIEHNAINKNNIDNILNEANKSNTYMNRPMFDFNTTIH